MAAFLFFPKFDNLHSGLLSTLLRSRQTLGISADYSASSVFSIPSPFLHLSLPSLSLASPARTGTTIYRVTERDAISVTSYTLRQVYSVLPGGKGGVTEATGEP